MRWLWFVRTDINKSWAGLEIPVHPNVVALFSIGLISHVGNGNNTFFWTDRWLFGCCIRDIAPNVFSAVPRKFLKRSVAEAFPEQRWPWDVGGLSVIGLFEYSQLWDIIQDFLLTTTKDLHGWRFESSGFFSSRSAHRAFFNGSIFEPWRCIWKSWGPGQV